MNNNYCTYRQYPVTDKVNQEYIICFDIQNKFNLCCIS